MKLILNRRETQEQKLFKTSTMYYLDITLQTTPEEVALIKKHRWDELILAEFNNPGGGAVFSRFAIYANVVRRPTFHTRCDAAVGTRTAFLGDLGSVATSASSVYKMSGVPRPRKPARPCVKHTVANDAACRRGVAGAR